MLYTDTDLFFLQFFVNELAKKIHARRDLRDAFDFSEIGQAHFSELGGSDSHSGEVGYFKDETKGDPIVEFVGLRPKMYLFTVAEASEPIQLLDFPRKADLSHKAVAKGVSRSQIKRFKH